MDNLSIHTGTDVPKDKLRSYNTLNTLYHETRQEIDLLNKQICLKDNIIADLKTRLGRYEGLRLMVGDNESVDFGPSQSLLESLCKEIYKLKQKRNDLEFKASRQEEEIQKLNTQLREKELELERVRCEPGHEKDQEIQRLRSALEEKEQSEATRTVLCTSLAEEADQLRSQLGATVKVCQELLARLEKKKKGEGEVEEVAQQEKTKDTTESSDMFTANAKICQLQEENKQLKQRVTYVQGLNSQWQKYDSTREDYIRGLCQQLKEITGPGSVSPGLLYQEITRLNSSLKEKMSECARLARELEEMKRQDQEKIQTLEQQVLIYAEDFKSERSDRERAQGQIQDLKEQIYQLKQLHKQQGTSRESRDVPTCRGHIGHRLSSRRHKDSAALLMRTTADTQQPAAALATSNPAWDEFLGHSELQCPRCHAKFSDTESAEYLNHWEECAKL